MSGARSLAKLLCKPFEGFAECGMALMNVIVVGGITMAVVGGTLEVMDRRVDQLRILRMHNRMDFIAKRVEESAQSPRAMTISSQKKGAVDLSLCLSGRKACSVGRLLPFDLYNSEGDLLSEKYDINGNDDCGKACTIEVETRFEVRCSGEKKACNSPSEVVTHYKVRQVAGKKLRDQLFNGRSFKTREGSVTLALFTCPNEGEYVVGVAADGTVACETPDQKVAMASCEGGTYSRGIDAKGKLRCSEPGKGLRSGKDDGEFEDLVAENPKKIPSKDPPPPPPPPPPPTDDLKKEECKTDLAIVMVLDVSKSMTKDGDDKKKERIDEAREAALQFVKMLKPSDRIATMTFSTNVKKLHDWSAPNTKVKTTIDDVDSDNGTTNMVDGLEYAFKLQGTAPLDKKVVLFMSDGINEQDKGSVKKSAQKFRDNNVDVWSIGFSPDVDDKEMEGIATDKSKYKRARNGAALMKAYSDIAKGLCRS